MGNRLSKITTKTGDQGNTGLADGSRVDKDDIIIETLGTIDELNSFIGLLLCEKSLNGTDQSKDQFQNIECLSFLNEVQQRLFDLGGEICLPDHFLINKNHIISLENQLNKLNNQLPPLKEFVLPNGTKATCFCHIARTVCRRAERRMVSLSKTFKINPLGLIYLNRLSDYLFVLSRYINCQNNLPEELWKNK